MAALRASASIKGFLKTFYVALCPPYHPSHVPSFLRVGALPAPGFQTHLPLNFYFWLGAAPSAITARGIKCIVDDTSSVMTEDCFGPGFGSPGRIPRISSSVSRNEVMSLRTETRR